MEVFLPGNETQTLTIIPRFNSDLVSLTVRRDENGELTVFELPTIYMDGYLSMEFTYDFIEDESYTLTVETPAGNLLWRGMGFSTLQTPQDYKINADIIQL